jgi:hypothetical protein
VTVKMRAHRREFNILFYKMTMRLLGIFALILANAALFSLLEAKIGSTLYYALIAFLSIFFVFCYVSIIKLDERVRKLENKIF